jgi:hypothetical protein
VRRQSGKWTYCTYTLYTYLYICTSMFTRILCICAHVQHEESIPLFERNLVIREAINDLPGQGNALCTLALSYGYTGQNLKAKGQH